jgi:ribosome biogenesis GTPase
MSEPHIHRPVRARVARADRGAATVLPPDPSQGPVRATVPHQLAGRLVVGDWVTVAFSPDGDPPTVTEVLPRTSTLARVGAISSEPHVIAANVDVVFVVVGLDRPLRLRRLERALALAWSSGAVPTVVLTKADACPDVAEAIEDAQSVALGTDVVAVSSVTGEGVDDLLPLVADRTVAMLGASGAGKTTLINRLTGGDLLTDETRKDGKGRHTTTWGELVPLPGGGLLVDTPGLKILGVWDDEGVDAAFADVTELASQCRFDDCAHGAEPGCAVRANLDPARLASWHKLQRELTHLAARQDARLAAEQRRRNRAFGRMQRAHRNRP